MITVDMLARTWQEIEYWLDIICATDGAQVEVYCSSGSQLPVCIIFFAGCNNLFQFYSSRRTYEFKSRTISEEY